MKKICLIYMISTMLLSFAVTAGGEILLAAGEAQGDCGSEVSIPVTISGNGGFAGFTIDMDYDNKYITPVAVTKGSMLSGQFIHNLDYGKEQRTIRAVFASATDVIADGELFFVTFRIHENLAGDMETALGLKLTFLSNQRLEELVAKTQDGKIKINKNENYVAVPEPTAEPQATEKPQASGGNYSLGGIVKIPAPKPSTPPDTAAEETSMRFADLEQYGWAREQIEFLAEKGIINGISQDSFAPSANIKRADFMLLIVRMLGLQAQVTDNFSDVGETQYYYREIGIAKAYGLTNGTGGRRFEPEGLITRQDMFVTAYRILKEKNILTGQNTDGVLYQFGDKDEVADYALVALEKLNAMGMIQGDDGRIHPVGRATRAETAVFICRLYEKIK